jgi:SOS-response transcriptional repressor LexA
MNNLLNKLGSNLNRLLKKEGLTSDDLSRLIGIPSTTIKRMRSGEANPTLNNLLPIAEYFSITLNQLVNGDPLAVNFEAKTLPLFSWQECCNYDSIDYDIFSKKILTERTVSKKAFALLVKEDEQEYFPGNSILIVDPEIEPNNGDYVIVGKLKQNMAAIRKYIIEIDKIYLKPLILGIDISALTSSYKILGVILQYKVELK